MESETPRPHGWLELSFSSPSIDPHTPVSARERLKTLALRVLVCGGLSVVIPGAFLLASLAAPDAWGAFHTWLGILGILTGLLGVGVTTLAVIDAATEGVRLLGRVRSDEAFRLQESAAPQLSDRGRAPRH